MRSEKGVEEFRDGEKSDTFSSLPVRRATVFSLTGEWSSFSLSRGLWCGLRRRVNHKLSTLRDQI